MSTTISHDSSADVLPPPANPTEIPPPPQINNNTIPLDLSARFPILDSEQQLISFLKQQKQHLTPDQISYIFKNPSYFITDVIPIASSYSEKLMYQYLETDSKEKFLDLLERDVGFTDSEFSITNETVHEMTNELKVLKEQVTTLKDDLLSKNKILLKNLTDLGKLNKTNTNLQDDVNKLKSQYNEMLEKDGLKIGEYSVSSIDELESLILKLESENNDLSIEVDQLEKKSNDQQSKLTTIDNELAELTRISELKQNELNNSLTVNVNDEINKDVEIEYRNLRQLLDTWNKL
ncbi:hypothetical protein CANARDRAFT_5826 [[Candida] arabinofermentans NRRL YB-2248]|uniref:Uncharacterized protein n=1 Tax=[Candida] arabinofermentans NRRL YB-2248 TaxID=983967 RepID=A0A1E4T694_9ASCO|nr:hypothetical protein CANARDRAFT_5826 [[Candida] arabinofermentans NRRL YB-2248]